MTTYRRWLQRIPSAVISIGALAVQVRANDWPSWRGPEQTGLTREKAVVKKWSPDGLNLLWKSPEGGRSTPIVMNGRLFFIGPVGDGECLRERVICLDAHTGRTIWEFRFNVFFTDIVANRVGWTSVAGDPETGNIYAHGTGGQLLCLDRDGRLLWQHSLMEEYNRVSGYGGRLMNPIVDEDRVIVSFLNTNWGNHARPAHRYVAFDKRSGAVRWWAEPGGPPADTTYAIPVVTVVDGKRLLIAPNADGKVYGLAARTGQTIWSFALSKMGLNSSPVADGKYAYVSHSEENLDTTLMGRIVCIDAGRTGDITKSGEVWRLDGLDAGYASPALANGRLYQVDNSANLHCVDARSGKHLWKHKLGRVGKGSAVVTLDGHIYVGEQNGVFHILRDAGDRCEELSRHAFPDRDGAIDELYGSPAVCGGRVYFMTRYGSYCLGHTETKVDSMPIPALATEPPAKGDPALLQVVPADVSLLPGETVNFAARFFTADGKPVSQARTSTTWTLAGVKGALGQDGTYTAPTDAQFAAGLATVTAGGLSAVARVRVSPRLPIREDFEKMPPDMPPPGWTGTIGKSKIVERDGSKVLLKLAEKGKPSPVWRMRAFSGPPIAGGYMVQADVMGTRSRRFKPDMGLINSRYELIMLGQSGELELSRWRDEPTHALRKRIPFELTPDTWYRMKLRVELDGGRANVRGRVWPRDGQEPAEWTIAFDDPCPNTEGSPGLFVYSNGTTDKSDGPSVFFDNYQVMVNE